MNKKRFERSRNNRIFFGVAGGLAEYSGRTAFQIRAFFVIATLLSIGTITIAYLAMAYLVPLSDDDEFDLDKYRLQ